MEHPMRYYQARTIILLCLGFVLTACHHTGAEKLVSLQLIDRSGFSETISTEDRLTTFKNADFLAPQPYQKIVRFYRKPNARVTTSIVTSYHENGSIWQKLDVVGGRAHGLYQEWHPNGTLKLETIVIEGIGDLSPPCIKSWIFHGTGQVWNEAGQLIAKIEYQKGQLHGPSEYFYESGQLREHTPYEKGQIDGNILQYDEKGNLIGNSRYRQGIKQGLTVFKGTKSIPRFTEEYKDGKLMKASYYDFSGQIASEIIRGEGVQSIYKEGRLQEQRTFQGGILAGETRIFDDQGAVKNRFTIKNGMKHGEEWIYYDKSDQPCMCLEWYEDELQGKVRTWYPNGGIESEKEVYKNKKHGPLVAWYRDGSLMLIEEYDGDLLVKGTYFARGNKEPVSMVDSGNGTATLYDADGHFINHVSYLKGVPFNDS